MQDVLNVLHKEQLQKERDTLESFYESVRLRAEGIDSASGKQKIVVELYDKFFRNAFPRMTERLGIVYTPVEVVDFIIHSVNHLLQKEFGQTLGSKGVHILDPFTGTGTFITRLLQSGLISDEELPHKYKNEIHANEIVLLAYYIAAINIEATYHDIAGGAYQPFEGICLTDTFQLYEKDDLISRILVDNSARRVRQKELDIRVILGNPPYSVGQGDANANNQNVAYPGLDERIRETYAERSTATNKNSLYDSYVRAIRWASDRVGDSGVVGFVTNAGFVDSQTADGLRKCLVDEFSSIYIFHLRGNQRTQGVVSRKEGGKIFGGGSRAPIAVSFLVKNPNAGDVGKVRFHDIGDYLSREEKLAAVSDFSSVEGVEKAKAWTDIAPDEHGDWLRQRDGAFDQFIRLGEKGKGQDDVLFQSYSSGVKTQRDAWCFNSSRSTLSSHVQETIKVYNAERTRFAQAHTGLSNREKSSEVDGFIDTDPSKISWTRALRQDLVKDKALSFDERSLVASLYRPFTKQHLYFNRRLNEMLYQMPKLFPGGVQNLAIMVKMRWSGEGQLALMVDRIPELQTDGGTQCFPLYLFEDGSRASGGQADLFGTKTSGSPEGRSAFTEKGVEHVRSSYPGEDITSEDIFYYVYGILHSEEYRDRFADNLAKELPRIPCVKSADDFWAFSKAGRALGDLHVKYDDVDMYSAKIETSSKGKGDLPSTAYRVEKMRYGKKKVDGKNVNDKSVLIYNDHITVHDIPLEAYEYVVNGKAALDWVVERQRVKTDKASGIVNDANDWATETMGNPKYPLELFLRVITVSLETMKIVKALPKLELP